MALGVIRGLRVGLGAILIEVEWVVWLCYIRWDTVGKTDSVKTVTVLGKPDKQSHRVLRNGFGSATRPQARADESISATVLYVMVDTALGLERVSSIVFFQKKSTANNINKNNNNRTATHRCPGLSLPGFSKKEQTNKEKKRT